MASTKTVTDRVKAHEAAVRKSLEATKLQSKLIVHFPNVKKPPVIGRFGVWLVNRYGGTIATKYQPVDGTITRKKSTKPRKK